MENGLTEEQRKRLSLIANLEIGQAELILGGILGILDSMTAYKICAYSHEEVAEKLLDDIDIMIAKAYEKGRYY
ncbi:hypothetical protein BC7_00057 [Bacillus phage BC-7]|nr:hypothetical protein BC7_00057 [Bacillus phage BC-7]